MQSYEIIEITTPDMAKVSNSQFMSTHSLNRRKRYAIGTSLSPMFDLTSQALNRRKRAYGETSVAPGIDVTSQALSRRKRAYAETSLSPMFGVTTQALSRKKGRRRRRRSLHFL